MKQCNALFPEFHFHSCFLPFLNPMRKAKEGTQYKRSEIPAPVLWPVRGRTSSPMYKEMRFWGLLLNCPSVFPRTHGFGVPFVLYTHVHNLRCRLPSRENAQTWKGQRKILKARWANLWRNTSDGVLRGKISVSWAIRPVSYPTAAATRDAPLERVMGVKRLSHFYLLPHFFLACFSFSLPI